MGARHTESFGEHLAAAVRGGYFIKVVEPSYDDERKRPERTYQLRTKKGNQFAASFKARSLPGCCGILVLFGFKGAGPSISKLIGIAEIAAKNAGYGAVLYTLLMGNTVYPNNERVSISNVMNGKTGNIVEIHLTSTGQTGKLGSPRNNEDE